MAEAWYKEWCPKCETHNWICNGDESDISGVDVESIKCRKCEHIFFLGDIEIEIKTEISGERPIEDTNWELGLENPN